MILLLICFSCKKENKNELNTKESKQSDVIKSRRLDFLPEPDKAERIKYYQNLNLNTFLESPINLEEFKKRKQTKFTSTVSNKKVYYSLPKVSDSIFFIYSYPTKKDTETINRINQLIVLKSGKKKHSYGDSSETLVELKIFNTDSDLGEANLVGMSKQVLESKFGNGNKDIENTIFYARKNKVLIINFKDNKIKSYNYLNSNIEKIDVAFVKQIIGEF